MSAPKWVKHPRFGWLPDECPLATCSAGVDGGLYELRPDGPGRSVYPLQVRLVQFQGNEHGLALLKECSPLTTAARDLLAALRAEAQS